MGVAMNDVRSQLNLAGRYIDAAVSRRVLQRQPVERLAAFASTQCFLAQRAAQRGDTDTVIDLSAMAIILLVRLLRGCEVQIGDELMAKLQELEAHDWSKPPPEGLVRP
jgi:hypothetical protein